MLKNLTRYILQKVLGYDNYLFTFARFTLKRLRNNKHEEEFIHFLGMIPKDGVVLDIGANIGVMTTAIAQTAPQGQVISFEPMPDNVNVIKKMVAHYKLPNVKLLEVALGDKPGELTMVLPILNKTKMQGLSHVKEEGNNDDWNKGTEFTVPVQVLDQMPELNALKRLDAIKIDVENYEYYVLKGGEQLLRKHLPIIYCELWKNEKRDMCIEMLTGIGYDVKIYENKKLIDFTGDRDATNFFFVAKKR